MEPVGKLTGGIIIAKDCELDEVVKALEAEFGPIDLRSELIPFDFTKYYEKEMGQGLRRQWISFEKSVFQSELGAIKHKCMKIEKEFYRTDRTRGATSRRVNIDPGYIDLSKLVLASTKDYSHRLYIGDGIHAEITLIYKDHHFRPLEWTYPDYRSNIVFFESVREKFKKSHGLD